MLQSTGKAAQPRVGADQPNRGAKRRLRGYARCLLVKALGQTRLAAQPCQLGGLGSMSEDYEVTAVMSEKMGCSQEEGPATYENWKAAEAAVPSNGGFEYPLFTDARILGHLSFGPYQLLNTISHASARDSDAQILSPAIVLRLEYYLEYEPVPMDRTDAKRYHGGELSDEIAALVALCLGIRLKSGGYTRRFDPNGV